ncbi:hypothetical protein KDH_09310 [Dictyobacter sp. S3.2.2.5]|uniref:Uncharacterized protein n=1 Tax=Dictyobacter halimunensis TaxID=3026934 RepID=A0ABQ6FK93_9CHLR|nr:hypothetical protein KDH_09310 [Dictyobacter sp. S3.2.2.5]
MGTLRKRIKSTYDASTGRDCKVQLAQMFWIGNRIDGRDFAVSDGETQEEQEPSTRSNNDSHRPVYEHWLCERDAFQDLSRSPGDGLCATNLPYSASGDGYVVGSEHNIRVEYCQECVEGSFARGGEERINDFSLEGQIGIFYHCHPLYPTAGTAGKLSGRHRRTFHKRRNLIEGHGENIVQNEGETLGGGKRVQDDQQRQAHPIGKFRLFLRVNPALVVGDRERQRRF